MLGYLTPFGMNRLFGGLANSHALPNLLELRFASGFLLGVISHSITFSIKTLSTQRFVMSHLTRAGVADQPLWGRRLASAPLPPPPRPKPDSAVVNNRVPRRPVSHPPPRAPRVTSGSATRPGSGDNAPARTSLLLNAPVVFADTNSSVPDVVAARRDELTEQASKLLNEGWSSSTKTSYQNSLSKVVQLEDHLDMWLFPRQNHDGILQFGGRTLELSPYGESCFAGVACGP